jgi:hypothetical protein
MMQMSDVCVQCAFVQLTFHRACVISRHNVESNFIERVPRAHASGSPPGRLLLLIRGILLFPANQSYPFAARLY